MDTSSRDRLLRPLLERAEGDKDVYAVVLFGSAARGEVHPGSDLDVCLFLRPKVSGFDKRIEYFSENDRLDVQAFSDLPVWIRIRLVREHQVLLMKDEDAFYGAAFATLREWQDFRGFYEAYLEETTLA